MIIQPKIRGFICTAAHPKGCQQNVAEQIAYVKRQGAFTGPQRVLVVGASTGYGLASRIVASFGAGAQTMGVSFEKAPSERKTGSAGWYNTKAFEQFAQQAGIYAKSFDGDAFSHEMKQQVIDQIKQDWGQVDLVLYSLASPRRVHPDTGEMYASTLKPVGQSFTGKTIDPFKGEVSDVTLEPANDEEVANTVAVMGGDDWALWMDALKSAGVLAPGAKTVAYSYIGPEMTHPIYKDGTIGHAKAHLHATAANITQQLADLDGQAFVSVNKAIVTQASAAIPVVPLYLSLLYKVMKAKGNHEGAIEQIYRLFSDRVYVGHGPVVDDQGLVRIDDWEMQPDVQAAVAELWPTVTTENIEAISDLAGYKTEFMKLFGFGFDNVNYEQDADPMGV